MKKLSYQELECMGAGPNRTNWTPALKTKLERTQSFPKPSSVASGSPKSELTDSPFQLSLHDMYTLDTCSVPSDGKGHEPWVPRVSVDEISPSHLLGGDATACWFLAFNLSFCVVVLTSVCTGWEAGLSPLSPSLPPIPPSCPTTHTSHFLVSGAFRGPPREMFPRLSVQRFSPRASLPYTSHAETWFIPSSRIYVSLPLPEVEEAALPVYSLP